MRKTAADRKNILIADLIAARQGLLSTAASVPPDQVDEPCIGTWCVKDLLAHLIGWDVTNHKAVEEILNEKRPAFLQNYDPDWKTYNAGLVAQYRKDSLTALISDAEQSHHALTEYLDSLSPSQVLEGKSPAWEGRPVTVRNLLRAEAEDERKHTEQVQAFLKRLVAQVHM